MSYLRSMDFKFSKVIHKDGSHGYIDEYGYQSLSVDHNKRTFVHYKKGCPSLNGSMFCNYLVKLLGIEDYQDVSVQTYIANTSEKKLKSQGLMKH